MAQKTPRTMQSKFDSTCCDCGRHIDKGETILYLGRNRAQCDVCMLSGQPISVTPGKPASNAQAWHDALSWDDSEPVAGDSIGFTDSTGNNYRDHPVKIPEKPIVCNDSTTVVVQVLPDDDIPDKSSERVQDEAQLAQILDNPSDRVEALTSELLIILVNAIDVAGITGRHAFTAFCRDNANRSIDHSTRQHLWRGFGQAIQQS